MKTKKLGLCAFIMMILTSVFGVTNIGVGFYRMGYAAIPMFIIGGVLFFVPFLFMILEFGTGFKKEAGGIYSWMEKSVSSKYAFIGIMIWYASYVIWMFGKALSIWVPLSFVLFGKDLTTNTIMFNGIDYVPFLLGMLGIILIIIVNSAIKMGPSKFVKISAIGGISVVALNAILIFGGIIVFIIQGGHLNEAISLNALFVSPNPDYNSIMPYMGFVVFAVFAYAGVEAMGGVADELENPKRDLKRGILLSGIFIIICYIVGFLMVGAVMKWSDFPSNVSSLSALFLIMQNLGNNIGGELLGNILMRFTGLGIFLSYLGALIALSYAPLKQLLGATPKEFWPESFQKENKNGIRNKAINIQMLIVIMFLLVKSIVGLFNPDGANALFELVITMTNVGMTVPCLFLIYAWYKFRTNDSLEKDLIMIKRKYVPIITIITLVVVSFGNIFTIIYPFTIGDLSTGIWTIVGPFIFAILAVIIYNKSNKKIK